MKFQAESVNTAKLAVLFAALGLAASANADCWKLGNGQVVQANPGAKQPQGAAKTPCPPPAAAPRPAPAPAPRIAGPIPPPKAQPQATPPPAPIRSAFSSCDKIVPAHSLSRKYTDQEKAVLNRCIAQYQQDAAQAEAKIRTYDKAIAGLKVVEKAGEVAGYAALALSGLEVVTVGAGAAKVLLTAGGKPVARAAVAAKINDVKNAAIRFGKHLTEEAAMHVAKEVIQRK